MYTGVHFVRFLRRRGLRPRKSDTSSYFRVLSHLVLFLGPYLYSRILKTIMYTGVHFIRFLRRRGLRPRKNDMSSYFWVLSHLALFLGLYLNSRIL